MTALQVVSGILIVIGGGVFLYLAAMIWGCISCSRDRRWCITILFVAHGVTDRARMEAEILRLIASTDKRDRPWVDSFEPSVCIGGVPSACLVGSNNKEVCSLDSGKHYPCSEVSRLSLGKDRPPVTRLEALDYARRLEELMVKGLGSNAERIVGGLSVSGPR